MTLWFRLRLMPPSHPHLSSTRRPQSKGFNLRMRSLLHQEKMPTLVHRPLIQRDLVHLGKWRGQ